MTWILIMIKLSSMQAIGGYVDHEACTKAAVDFKARTIGVWAADSGRAFCIAGPPPTEAMNADAQQGAP